MMSKKQKPAGSKKSNSRLLFGGKKASREFSSMEINPNMNPQKIPSIEQFRIPSTVKIVGSIFICLLVLSWFVAGGGINIEFSLTNVFNYHISPQPPPTQTIEK